MNNYKINEFYQVNKDDINTIYKKIHNKLKEIGIMPIYIDNINFNEFVNIVYYNSDITKSRYDIIQKLPSDDYYDIQQLKLESRFMCD